MKTGWQKLFIGINERRIMGPEVEPPEGENNIQKAENREAKDRGSESKLEDWESQPRQISQEEWDELWESTKGAKPEGFPVKQSRKVLLGDTWYEFFGGMITKEGGDIIIEVPEKGGRKRTERIDFNDSRIKMVMDDYGQYVYENLAQNPDLKPKQIF